jgi:DNA-binding transcriptional ArsR family regulator
VKASRQAGEKKRGESICGVLKHPLRVRILEVLNEGPKSPSQFVEEGLVPKEHYSSYQAALSLAAYHFRELKNAGLLEIAETIPKRGAVEHVYRGLARVYFTDAEFERLAPQERRQFSRISFQGLVARVDSAMLHDSFDSRTDRHLAWMPLSLDEQGWDELGAAMATCFSEVERIATSRKTGWRDQAIRSSRRPSEWSALNRLRLHRRRKRNRTPGRIGAAAATLGSDGLGSSA